MYSLFVAYTGGVPNTVVDATPVIAEKPFFYVNARYLGAWKKARGQALWPPFCLRALISSAQLLVRIMLLRSTYISIGLLSHA